MNGDIFLIVSVVILGPLLLGLCLLILAYFGHPDDQNQAYVPKFITVLGLFLAFSNVLALPYDVENSRSGGNLRTDILWEVLYIVTAVFLVVIIPFSFFYYESDVNEDLVEDRCDGQLCSGIKYTAGFMCVFIFVLVLMFSYLATAEVPVQRIVHHVALTYPWDQPFTSFNYNCQLGCYENLYIWSIPVGFPTYVGAFIAWVGWFLFVLFGGIGLVALPMDLINEWRTRPVHMTKTEYDQKARELGRRAKHLAEIGEEISRDMDNPKLSRSKKRENKSAFKEFEAAFYFVKNEYEVLRVSYDEKGGNPLWYIFKLVLGCIGFVLSATWVLHIVLFVLPRSRPIHPFLNDFFIQLEEVGGVNGGFPLFGVVAYGIYALWLQWCVIKGNFRFGARFLFFTLYPMELNNTMMNAFLFNTWLILLCSLPIVQFCVTAFPIYARDTSVDVMLGTQARYLQFFKYFFDQNVFVFALLAVAFLSFVLMMAFPKNRAEQAELRIRRAERGEDD